MAPPLETKVTALNVITSGFRATSVVELYPLLRFHVNASCELLEATLMSPGDQPFQVLLPLDHCRLEFQLHATPMKVLCITLSRLYQTPFSLVCVFIHIPCNTRIYVLTDSYAMMC